MAFSGTLQKCKGCDKVVHFIEMLKADGIPYHKACFKCSHCHSVLAMSSYSTIDGDLYCKPHYEQLFKEKSGLSKKPQSSGAQNEKLNRIPSKNSSFFSGTQEKCSACNKTVYPMEKVTVEGAFYHKLCFKCAHGGCKLNPSSYAALDGYIYCKPHFAQLFKEKGSYSHLTKTASVKKIVTPGAPADESNPELEPQTPNSDQTQEQQS
ncbi:hypothetical protein CsSME_00044962 [Camellia sinensis var. sinensis]|uniref:LIM zinc-binding domain-containing protein n=1 Tax=Camellia sinensis TaxID=4442 RepID=A0A7J7GDL3_CAMSI|nr:LIM domain-containing protein WLIM2b-like [Camellia sinensis]KAF5938627.1 hypothetical protein HYC85_022886 [Camellia sinensis]